MSWMSASSSTSMIFFGDVSIFYLSARVPPPIAIDMTQVVAGTRQ
jgi:hypothetical protein